MNGGGVDVTVRVSNLGIEPFFDGKRHKSYTNYYHNLSSFSIYELVHTDVIVEVALTVVEPLVDDDFLHPQRLLLRWVGLIQGVFPQGDEEAAVFGGGAEKKSTN